MMIAFFLGCQDTYPKKELVLIKDVDYSPETKTTLVTVEHQGGCKHQNYQYTYQELNNSTTDKTLTYGLFVEIQGNCKKKDVQFIRIPVPRSSFSPNQLIFQSSDNKKIIFIPSDSEAKTIAQIRPEIHSKIAIIEDASFNQAEQKITLNAFIPGGCGENYTHRYKILEQDSTVKSASLALITEVADKCDRGDYQKVKMPLPELTFKPDKLVFPISDAKQIMLTITPSQNK